MYLLGIDNGGSDIKCAVYDLNGKELAISRTQIPMNIPEAGFTERDVENVWEANVKVIKAVLKKAEIPGEDELQLVLPDMGMEWFCWMKKGNLCIRRLYLQMKELLLIVKNLERMEPKRKFSLIHYRQPGLHSRRFFCRGSEIISRRC